MFKLHAKNQKKIAIGAIAAVLILGGGGAAFAYWPSTGTGTGSATTGENTDFVVTDSAPVGAALTPGGPSQSTGFRVANSGTGGQALSSVLVTIANSDGTAWVAIAGCSAADYSVTVPTVAYGTITGGGHVDGTVSVSMVDSALNQDSCQGVTVPLYFVAS